MEGTEIRNMRIEPVSANRIKLTGMSNIRMDIYDQPLPGKFELIVDFPGQKDGTRILVELDGTVKVSNIQNRFTAVHVGEELLEELAALEHDQWAHWTSFMIPNVNEKNVERWNRQIATPYKDLTESEKESDRVYARNVIEILKKHGLVKKGNA